MEKRQCRACGTDIVNNSVYCTLCESENVGASPQMNAVSYDPAYEGLQPATRREKLTFALIIVAVTGALLILAAKYNGLF